MSEKGGNNMSGNKKEKRVLSKKKIEELESKGYTVNSDKLYILVHGVYDYRRTIFVGNSVEKFYKIFEDVVNGVAYVRSSSGNIREVHSIVFVIRDINTTTGDIEGVKGKVIEFDGYNIESGKVKLLNLGIKVDGVMDDWLNIKLLNVGKGFFDYKLVKTAYMFVGYPRSRIIYKNNDLFPIAIYDKSLDAVALVAPRVIQSNMYYMIKDIVSDELFDRDSDAYRLTNKLFSMEPIIADYIDDAGDIVLKVINELTNRRYMYDTFKLSVNCGGMEYDNSVITARFKVSMEDFKL